MDNTWKIIAINDAETGEPKHESWIGMQVKPMYDIEAGSVAMLMRPDFRMIRTTVVQSTRIDGEGEVLTFVTKNSIYLLEKVGAKEPVVS
jgi:hypothetical protein